MKIRKAKIEDLQAIQNLNNQLFGLELENFDKYLIKNWPLSQAGKEYFENAIKNDCVLVAEDTVRGGIVGYLLGSVTEIPYYDFKIAELCNMCVDKSFRKSGIGTKLFEAFEKYYKKLGITHFIVTASFKNESAKRFYKKIGFEEANLTLIKF